MKFLSVLPLAMLASADLAPVYDHHRSLPGYAAKVDCAQLDSIERLAARRVAGQMRTWQIGDNFCAIGGDISKDDVSFLRGVEGVEYIESNVEVHLVGEQVNPPSWGIDRVDQANLPLDNLYRYNDGANGDGANVYVLDTGIFLQHSDWNAGQANFGIDCSDLFGFCTGNNQGDPNGHGTHCAGSIASPSYGVAKSAEVWDVKVISAAGTGGLFGIISGLDFVEEHNTPNAKIISMSLGAVSNFLLDNAINAVYEAGVAAIAAAGNENQDACNVSPAGAEGAFAVAASDINDQRAVFSNWGSCVDLFAPGVDIVSLGTSPDSNQTYSGTSMACPHAAGAAAILASEGITDPQAIYDQLNAQATVGVIGDVQGSPNRFLFTNPQ